MVLHQNLFGKLTPRQVKFFTVVGIGLVGIAIATVGYMFSENQSVQIAQVGTDLFYSPVGTAIVKITSFLFC